MNTNNISEKDKQGGDSEEDYGKKINPHAKLKTKLKSEASLLQFDLDAIRLNPGCGENLVVRRHITRIPVGKPRNTTFFRVFPDSAWWINAVLLENKEENETFLFSKNAYDLLPELQKPATLYTAVDRNGNPFLIPVLLPGPDGRRNPWHQSLELVVLKAQEKWVRCVANMPAGAYDMLVAEADLTAPEWPPMTFEEMLAMAFRGKIIDGPDHPVVRKLKGLA